MNNEYCTVENKIDVEYYDMEAINKYYKIEDDFEEDDGEFDKLLWSKVDIEFVMKIRNNVDEHLKNKN